MECIIAHPSDVEIMESLSNCSIYNKYNDQLITYVYITFKKLSKITSTLIRTTLQRTSK